MLAASPRAVPARSSGSCRPACCAASKSRADPTPAATVVINPISGTAGSPAAASRQVLADLALRSRGIDGRVVVSEYAGHARVLAREAIEHGSTLVIAWGGDGTMNEVASELAFRDAALGIVPSGSGNGLARELAVPFDARAAFAVACDGRERVIDAAELDGRMFFNVAGIGFDARVAHEFAATGHVRRGFRRYLQIAARELFQFDPDDHAIVVDGGTYRTRALVVAIANGRQYGNGALIAPGARIDDGLLEVVIVEQRSPLVTIVQAPLLFAGRVDRLPGVTMVATRRVQIAGERPVVYHIDGEPFVGGSSIHACVRPGALRVRVP